MHSNLKLIAASLAAPLAIGLAAPAPAIAAAPQDGWGRDYRERSDYRERDDHRGHRDYRAERRLQHKLDELRQDIRQARRSGQISRHEAMYVRQQFDQAERAFYASSRNGFSRRDIHRVNWRIDQAYDALRQARYRSTHRGYEGRGDDRRRRYRRDDD